MDWGWGEQRSLEHGEALALTSRLSLHFLSYTLPIPQLVEGNFALFCTYTLGFRNEFQNLLLAIMVCVGPRGWVGSLDF